MRKRNTNRTFCVVTLLTLIIIFSGCSQSYNETSNQTESTSPKFEKSKVLSNLTSRAEPAILGVNYFETNTTSSAIVDIDEIKCPETVSQVCGSDGVTYSNSCYAAKANVTITKAVACDVKIPLSSIITYVFDPTSCPNVTQSVCGFSTAVNRYITFKNECLARAVGASSITNGTCAIVKN